MLLRDGKITDEIRRRIERDLDLEKQASPTANIAKGRCRDCEDPPRKYIYTSRPGERRDP